MRVASIARCHSSDRYLFVSSLETSSPSRRPGVAGKTIAALPRISGAHRVFRRLVVLHRLRNAVFQSDRHTEDERHGAQHHDGAQEQSADQPPSYCARLIWERLHLGPHRLVGVAARASPTVLMACDHDRPSQTAENAADRRGDKHPVPALHEIPPKLAPRENSANLRQPG